MIMFDVSPKPLTIPGNATVTLIGILAHTLSANSHYKLNVTMYKQLLGNWHHVPEITLEPGKYRHLICVKLKYYIIVLTEV